MLNKTFDSARNLIDRKPFFAAALFTGVCFSIVLCLVHLSLIADDFNYFSKVYSAQGLQFWALSDFIARVPLAVLLTPIFFYLPGAEQLAVPAILTFLIFAFSTARLFSFFTERVRPDMQPQLAFWALSVFLLYPTHYEILYWLTAMPYIVGLGLWALSLGRSTAVQILLLAATFLISEMFVLPALLFPHFITLAKGDFNLKKEWREPAKWAAAIIIWFVVRKIIEIKLNIAPFHYYLGFSPPFVAGRLRDTFFQVYSIQFFKVLWVNTAIYWLALLAMLTIILRRRALTIQKFALLFVFTFLATAIYWFFDRNAPRALFGAQIIICLFVFYVTTLLDFKTAKKFLIVFALVFVAATGKIFVTKWKNHSVLMQMESTWKEKLMACQDPCNFEVRKLDDGIRGDWVMAYGSWPDFIRFIQNKYQIKKTLNPTFIETTGE